MSDLARYVRQRREQLRKSQVQIQRDHGVPQAYLSDIERGTKFRLGKQMRIRLAEALEVTTVELLLKAGEISREELEEWARGARILEPSMGDGWAHRLADDLEGDVSGARKELATMIPLLLHKEAQFILGVIRTLPSEAKARREDLAKTAPEDYRRWRDTTDVLHKL